MRAKNVSCATVDLLLVDKVLMVEAKANKVKSKDNMIKEEEEEVATRPRRKSRCLEVNWQSCSRSWKGLPMIMSLAIKKTPSFVDNCLGLFCSPTRRMTMTLAWFPRMEAEMTIVSEESRELADTLEEREIELLLKVRWHKK